MADKITLIRSTDKRSGSREHIVFYFYTINPRVTDSKGTVISPQTSAGIPAEVARYFTAADLAAIDAGDAGYEQIVLMQTGGETGVAFRARVLADHAARETLWVQARRDDYALAGMSAS